jgi:hypothetical protein
MWCDDFDADLYRVVPEAERLIAPVAHVEMRTVGHTTHGRLNSPSRWNHYYAMIAFFGCRLLGQRHWKSDFYSSRDPVVECTFEEAIRDTWVHGCVAIVDGHRLWNTWKLQRSFDVLMYHARGWFPDSGRYNAEAAAAARRNVLREIARACRRIQALVAA